MQEVTAAPRVILLVDDEPGLRHFIHRLLEEHGYKVREAGDGVEALEAVRTGPEQVDLVVSDLVMPRLNGIQLLHALAAENPELPVLLISGYGAVELPALGVRAPCAVLAKPVAEEVLLAQVERCLRPRADPLTH